MGWRMLCSAVDVCGLGLPAGGLGRDPNVSVRKDDRREWEREEAGERNAGVR